MTATRSIPGAPRRRRDLTAPRTVRSWRERRTDGRTDGCRPHCSSRGGRNRMALVGVRQLF
ncbi:hypothetical protein BKA80DRAFT_264324 [Phyllosticta citrichinensis]